MTTQVGSALSRAWNESKQSGRPRCCHTRAPCVSPCCPLCLSAAPCVSFLPPVSPSCPLCLLPAPCVSFLPPVSPSCPLCLPPGPCFDVSSTLLTRHPNSNI
ncbi:hypothetical protein Pcinc_038296 [Petrolisthes cinctipes]|uniref:Uncharacterized protein n=1 Tax=Petrolisthes cinctipes TaxID=88211 RepID=A0AAE1BU80_PETCI|nr:hypothetical protein Pcinc_038296 [Petrolisthes cinctipes]